MKKITLEGSLLESIANPELINVTTEITESGIDQLTKNELLKKIPFLDVLVASYSTFKSVRDYLFLKKISRFLMEQGEISLTERKKWLLENQGEKLNKVGESVIEIIDKFSSVEKAKILGILFTYHVKAKISSEQFIRLGEMVNAAYIDDIYYFLKTPETQLGDLGDEVDHLLSTGFLQRGGTTMGGGSYFPNKQPEHSDFGKLFFNFLSPRDFQVENL